MQRSDEEIKRDWSELDHSDIDMVCDILRGHEAKIQEYLAEIVSSLCEENANEMMTDSTKVKTIHARWLFWYAYRYMTNETYNAISEITLRRWGKKYTEPGISHSVNQMGGMIDSNSIWTKRWNILKRIIKLRDTDVKEKNVGRVIIQTPLELKDFIKIEIKK